MFLKESIRLLIFDYGSTGRRLSGRFIEAEKLIIQKNIQGYFSDSGNELKKDINGLGMDYLFIFDEGRG